jgi:hypothetical protein
VAQIVNGRHWTFDPSSLDGLAPFALDRPQLQVLEHSLA